MGDVGRLPPHGAGGQIQAGGPKGAKEPSGLIKLVRAIANALGAVFRALIPGNGIGKKVTEGAPDQGQSEKVARVANFLRADPNFQAFQTATSSDHSPADQLGAIREHFTKVNQEIMGKNIKGYMQLQGPYIARAEEVLNSLPANLNGLAEMKEELSKWKEEHKLYTSSQKRVAVAFHAPIPTPSKTAPKSPAPTSLSQADIDARVKETEAYEIFEKATDSSKPYVERFNAAKTYLNELSSQMRTKQLRGVYLGQKPFLDRVGEVLKEYDAASSVTEDQYKQQLGFLEGFIEEYESIFEKKK